MASHIFLFVPHLMLANFFIAESYQNEEGSSRGRFGAGYGEANF